MSEQNRKNRLEKLAATWLVALVFVLLLPASTEAQQERMSWDKFRQDPNRVKAFKKAIRAMQALPKDDPRSWFFQANIHDEDDPEENGDWSQCEHGTWQFFTWHRIYIHYFEDILRKYAESDTLRVPYWPWEQQGQRKLPEEFRVEFEPDGVTPNPLFVKDRQMNDSSLQVRWQQANYDRQMRSTSFIGLMVAGAFVQGFGGGGRPVSGPDQGAIPGTFELYPHNALHGDIGGAGWMGDPTTAAQDPIFWLHHVNIDRHWERWRTQPGRTEPDGTWRTKSYFLYDRDKQRRERKVEEFLRLAVLGYKYDDVALPPPALVPPNRLAPLNLALAADSGGTVGSPTPAPLNNLKVFVLANPKESKTLTIEKAPVTVEVAQQTDLAPKLKALLSEPATPASKGRIFLKIEGVKFNEPPRYNFEVYLNKRDASHRTKAGDAQYAGTISIFGAGHHKKQGEGHDAGMTFRFDVTECLTSAKKVSSYDPQNISVTVVPIGPETAEGATDPAKPVKVTVGKVSLETLAE